MRIDYCTKKTTLNGNQATKAASTGRSINNLLLTELNTEANNWKQLLERFLNVILFLSERGLAFWGSSQRIGDC